MTRMINSTCIFFFFFFYRISKVNVITLLVPFLFAKRTNRMIHKVVSFFVSRVSDNETSRKVRNIDANSHRVITRSGFILWSRFAARAKFNQSSQAENWSFNLRYSRTKITEIHFFFFRSLYLSSILNDLLACKEKKRGGGNVSFYSNHERYSLENSIKRVIFFLFSLLSIS